MQSLFRKTVDKMSAEGLMVSTALLVAENSSARKIGVIIGIKLLVSELYDRYVPCFYFSTPICDRI